MEAEKKARELVYRFDETLTYLESKQKAKECALIAVDEILKEMNIFIHLISDNIDWSLLEHTIDSKNHYYQQVKQEIEKL